MIIKRGKFFLLFLLFPLISVAYGKTIILDGNLSGKININQNISFDVERPLKSMKFKFALPAEFSNPSVSQKIINMNIKFKPEPENVEDKQDTFGNHFKIVKWSNVSQNINVKLSFQVDLRTDVKAMESKSPYPLEKIPENEKVFLKPTPKVQSDSEIIKNISKNLVKDARSEYEAVTKILNYVVDIVKYTYNPPQYDAIYTLNTKSGNCQNYAHLAIALLRAAGIPARIVGGISLKEPLKIPVSNNQYVVQSLGQGGHAWIEVYFPDLGWLSYDPQQSKQFTSTRHIKQTHGLDSDDINDMWLSSPYVPVYNEFIDAQYLDDKISLIAKRTEGSPKSYLFSNDLIAKETLPHSPSKPSVPPVKPEPQDTSPQVVVPSEKPETDKKPVMKDIGNLDFPDFVKLFRVEGDKGIKILDKETAEYVTSKYVFAQAFSIDRKAKLIKISLAMRKFGGDGTVYVDLVKDQDGKPSLTGYRSNPIFVEKLKKQPGYYWIEFNFPENIELERGRYWIVFRHSGEVIMNWYYIPGNPYGDEDDTRSTLKGFQWEDIQNYDFVFKVALLM